MRKQEMYFKDEGNFFMTRIPKEGVKPIVENGIELGYPYGSLKEVTFSTRKECRKYAKEQNCTAVFDN